jgi:hypothetical protein
MDGRKQIYHRMLNLVANRLLIWVLDQFTGPKWAGANDPLTDTCKWRFLALNDRI